MLARSAVSFLLLLGASAGAEPIRKVNPAGVAPPVGAYSHLAVVPPGSRLLFVAGQIGNRPDGSLATTVEEQIEQAYDNVRAILAAEGAGPETIVKMTIYAAARPSDWARIVKHRTAMFKGTAPPPSTWVYVSGLIRPEYLVEVEAIAAVPPR